jgi:acetyl-CoA acetyltransferase
MRRRRDVAIVGVGTTPYERRSTKTTAELVADACRAAIVDAGLEAADVNGLCGSRNQASPSLVQRTLGIPALTWWSTPSIPFSLLLGDAVNAVQAGACEVAVVYQAQSRGGARPPTAPRPEAPYYAPYGGRSSGYAGYMRRYLHEYGVDRTPFGRIAVNGRSHAATNPHAALREPLTLTEYLDARMIREPMSLLDIDYGVAGGDAVVVTTGAWARDLDATPVYVEALAYGQHEQAHEDLYPDLDATGQPIAAAHLWSLTDVRPHDADLVFLYDGFTIIAIKWLESLGFCGPGEAGPFIESCWDADRDRIELGGGVLINPHGGSLSEGATQGAGHVREAVTQLRGAAGARQVAGATTALLGIGGLFTNATALVLRTR